MKSDVNLIEIEKLYLALADKTRLRILNLLRGNEVRVYYLTEILKLSQPKISRHLAFLRNSGLVSARREGKWMNYKIDFPLNIYAARLIDETLNWLASQDQMQNDYKHLMIISPTLKNSGESFEKSTANISGKTDGSPHYREELEVFLL